MAIHSVENGQTGFTPNMMTLGREIYQPLDILLGTTNCTSFEPPAWVTKIRDTLQDVHELARSNLRQRQIRQKRDYDITLSQLKLAIARN